MGFSLFDIYRVHGFFLFFVVHGQWGFPDAHCLAGSDPSAHLDTKYNIEDRTIISIILENCTSGMGILLRLGLASVSPA